MSSEVVAKAALRRRIRADRAARVAAGSDGAPAAVLACALAAGLLDSSGRADGLDPVSVAAYLAMPGEPDPQHLCSAVRGVGGTVLLPVPRAGRTLVWAVDDGSRGIAAAPVRVPVPLGRVVGSGASALATHRVGLILIPALAVDHGGRRLGQGGGYYDALLAEIAGRRAAGAGAPRVVALVADEEIVDADIPVEAHDQRVDGALTPSGVLWFAAEGPRG